MSNGVREGDIRPHRSRGVLFVAALLIACAARAVSADSTEDVLAGTRLLQAAAPQPLAQAEASAITRDVGAIAVIEHDGSDYSKETGMPPVPNYAPRAAVARTFYQTHGDFYDFLVVFTNFEFETGDAVAFHNYVRNDVQGIHKPIGDNGELFGSSGRLLGYVDMAAIERYTTKPLSVRRGVLLSASPADEGFRDALGLLGHEIGHQWLAEVRFRDASGVDSENLLGSDGAHWSYLLDSDASLMYGSDWTPFGDGLYRASRIREGYSALDRYLMGFLDGSKVPPLTLLRNPAVSPTGLPNEGDVISATPETVTLEQIVAAEGARSPGFAAAPKTFRAGFVLLTAEGVEPSPEELAAVDRIRRAFVAHFFALTHGAALVETSLAEEPSSEPAPAVDLEKAAAWLQSQQMFDGHWEDSSWTATRDTAAALDAWTALGLDEAANSRGRLWLKGAAVASLDFIARRAAGLGLGTLTSAERTALVNAVLAQQNVDGGFGAGPGYSSDPLDTALALRALAGLEQPAGSAVSRALSWLALERVPTSGGWPAVSQTAELSTIATAHVLLALQDWSSLPEAQALAPGGLAALLSRRNADGGFGESPSTSYATALALQVLTRAGGPAETRDAAVAWLQQSQLLDGSWEGSTYATALVLSALAGSAANLVVPPDSVTVDPPNPTEGDVLHVAARVQNVGSRPADSSVAQLFDGDPARTTAVAQFAVPPLEPGESATVTFDLDTTGRAGTRALYVVADAEGVVSEAREDDNTTQRAVTVAGLLPDLTLLPGDLRVEPYPPEVGETVEIAVTIRNIGERPSGACALRVVRVDSHSTRTQLGELVSPSIDPGAALTLSVPWDTTRQEGQHQIRAIADAKAAVYESDELNNELQVPVTVTGPQSGGVDLEVTEMTVTPFSLETLPQSVVVRALVRNLGRDAVASNVTLSEGELPDGVVVTTQPVELTGRSSTPAAFPIDVTSPGSRLFVLTADAENQVSETDEANNVASVVFADPANTYDVEVRPEELTLSAPELVVGSPLTVTAVVRNRGTAAFTELPVILGHVVGDDVLELARRLVTLEPGASTVVGFEWQASIEGDPVPLMVRADPFDLLAELSETNNEAPFSVRVLASSLANLSVSGADVSFSPDPPLEGQETTVSAVVRNPSSVDAGPFVVRLYVGDPDQSGIQIGDDAVEFVAARSSVTVTRSWMPSNLRGQQGLFVLADALGQVEEYDEADNRAFRPFAVTGLPDLVLTTAELTLDPGYPRSGESVTIRALVRNLGQQTAPESTLRALEGPSLSIGERSIPELAPGRWQLIEIPWTPSSPAGERLLSVVVDADGAVPEQDEGNNLARRTVLVQDADLFLTEPFFSPNGDGVKDETTLGYRATGTVSIVVSNSRGTKVRTLATDAPANGSATWDGRSDSGRVLPDGSYTFTIQGDGDLVLAHTTAVLDTDRSPIHNAAETGFLAVRGLTCNLPTEAGSATSGPVWMPNDEEALYLIRSNGEGFAPGLLRVDREGNRSYVAQGSWWDDGHCPTFASPVSPDGRQVLIRKAYVYYLVDLHDGSLRPVENVGDGYGQVATWSPDGRWMLAQTRSSAQVFTESGELLVELPQYDSSGQYVQGWRWSADGSYLVGWINRGDEEGDLNCMVGVAPTALRTQRNATLDSPAAELQNDELLIVRPDGSEYKRIRLPIRHSCYLDLSWRGDGSIYIAPGSQGGYAGCGFSEEHDATALIVDPGTGATRSIPSVFTGTGALVCHRGPLLSWSRDGSRALRRTSDYYALKDWTPYGEVVLEDGSRNWSLWGGEEIRASQWGSVGTFTLWVDPLTPCNKSTSARRVDFALGTLQNLTASLTASRLPANNGILVRATASDLNLDHHQLDYAVEGATDTWIPIGPSSDVPVLDDILTVWVPPDAGRYLLRLRVWDRAGNTRTRTKVVSWDHRPSIANISFDEALISPNDDGVKDAVTFNYLVIEPTRLDVRIAGPGADDETPGPTVRQFTFEYSTFGSESFTWDGRDEGRRLVADGRYTVYLNDLPFRIGVDATPPDVSVAYDNLRAEERLTPDGKVGAPVADKLWHVFDAHLKGAEPVYEPERDADGQVIYDDGVPRPKRVGGRLVDREDVVDLKKSDLDAFVVEDYAGNRSTVTPHHAPGVRLLEMRLGTEDRITPPIVAEVLYRIRPQTAFHLFGTVPGEVRFERRTLGADGTPVDPWTLVSRQGGPSDDEWGGASPGDVEWAPEDLTAYGLVLGSRYQGRFVLDSPTGDIPSQEFSFTLCDEWVELQVGAGAALEADPTKHRRPLTVMAGIDAPIASVEVRVHGRGYLTVPLTYEGKSHSGLDVYGGAVTVPQEDCDGIIITYEAVVVDVNGVERRGCDTCIQGTVTLPACGPGGVVALDPAAPRYCEASPDKAAVDVHGSSQVEGGLVIVEQGPPGSATRIAEFPVPVSGLFPGCVPLQSPPDKLGTVVVDVAGLPDGAVTVRGLLMVPDQLEPVATAEVSVPIDHTLPVPEILLPDEDAQLCPGADNTSGRELGTILLRVRDAGATVKLGTAEFRYENGPWVTFDPVCLEGAVCHLVPHVESGQWDRIIPAGPNGVPWRIGWDATDRPDGQYTVRLEFCDEAGNHASIERRFSIYRRAAPMKLVTVLPAGGLFSPNGDGQVDEAVLTVRTFQSARLMAEVRAGTEAGAVIRELPVKDPAYPGDHTFTWDGRDDGDARAPDGRYVVVFSAEDPCGGRARLTAPVVVDNAPPIAVIDRPATNATVSVGVDVVGRVHDAHFASFELLYGAGVEPPTWLSIAAGDHAVSPSGLLSHWDVPSADGIYTLRLVALDRAQNRSQVDVRVNVAQVSVLGRLSAAPAIFSPNGDGRRDTTTIEYELLASARVTLQIETLEGDVLRSLLSGTDESTGVHQVVWDGLADGGAAVPDAGYVVRIRAEEVDTGVPQQATTGVILDRAPPTVTSTQPVAGGFLTHDASVVGSIQDEHLLAYFVSAVSVSGGSPTAIGDGVQNRSEAELGSLASLADGGYRLRIEALDEAENETQLEVPFTIDSVPPYVRFESPLAGAVLDTTAAAIVVHGTVEDANLDHFTLSAGRGLAPAVFDSVARGESGGETIPLGAWAVATLPDDDYTLRLQGVDRAGSEAELLRSVILDGTPPEAVIDSPGEAGYVRTPQEVIGTAADQNLASWDLEVAPGEPGTAYEWSLLTGGVTAVRSSAFTSWTPLPADGVYTLRLTVRDRADHQSTALRRVNVDQTPPAAPTGLVGTIVERQPDSVTIRLSWDPNLEPDLAGYRVSRDGQLLTSETITVTTHDDPGCPEGEYAYEVVALDLADNTSLPASTTVKVDLTPPLVEIQVPAAGAAVSGTVDVRGTAWSAADFKEYRLYVGASEEPTSWTLVARSTLSRVGERLGTWDALVDGPYVLALEAEDLDGNQARVTRPVVVDTLPPEKPMLVSVLNEPADTATLTSTWLAGASSDVAGYLLYRGERLANAPGIVIGDLRPFLIEELTYADAELPDGQYCYHVVAMDEAGNTSEPSNVICEALDRRAPRATIVDPSDGWRFDYLLQVVAESPDTDIASVQFQIRPHDESTWNDLGGPDTALSYQTTLDPASLELGDYDLRAVATDVSGKTDPEAPWITVTHGDTRPPTIPTGLVAHVDGRQVHLSWNANGDADLAGYHVFRDGERITTTPLTEPVCDEERDPGEYEYAVTAIDADDNESGLSDPAAAVVYQMMLESPAWPVTLEASATLEGDGARPETTVQILAGDVAVAEMPASDSAFEVAEVPLTLEGNVLRARGIDTDGNLSIPSDDVVVIRNVPPAPVTGLTADVLGQDVDLAWDPNADADRYGHVVDRDEARLTPTQPISDGISVSASSTYPYCYRDGSTVTCDASYAIDGDPATSWVPYSSGGPHAWVATFPMALVDRVVLGFGDYHFGESRSLTNYRVEVGWEGRYVPVAEVVGNEEGAVEHVFEMPFATDSLRVVVDAAASSRAGLAEVEIWKVDVLGADATAFRDTAVPDGYHDYAVRAVDRYGAESDPAGVCAAVGDVEPPTAPVALVATVVGSDVRLTWTANGEADLQEYLVFRDGEQIGTSPEAEYLDAGRPNGEYTYVVKAVDQAGNGSAPSNEAVAVVAVVVPPPVLRGVARPDGRNALDWDHPGAAGFILYRALAAGGPHEEIERTGDVRSFVDDGVTHGIQYFYVARAVDAPANDSLLSNEVAIRAERTEPPAAPVIFLPTDAAHPIALQATQTDVGGKAEHGPRVALSVDGALVGYAATLPAFAESGRTRLVGGNGAVAFSGDARRIAYQLLYVDEEYGDIWHVEDEIRVLDRVTGAMEQIRHDGSDSLSSPQLSFDGSRLAYRAHVWDPALDWWGYRLFVVDLAQQSLTALASGRSHLEAYGWAPSGDHLAAALFVSDSSQPWVEVWNAASDERRTLLEEGAVSYVESMVWSPDGTRLAIVSGYPREVRLVDAETGEQTPIAPGSEPSWSSDGQRLVFVGADGGVVAYSLATGESQLLVDAAVEVSSPMLDPTGGWLSYRMGDGCPETVQVLDVAAGEQRTIDVGRLEGEYCYWPSTAWTREGRLAVSFADAHIGEFGVEAGFFEFRDVALTPGENVLVARSEELISGLVSPDSEPVVVAAPASVFPDLEVTSANLRSFPTVPVIGRTTSLSARVFNIGEEDASGVGVTLTVTDPDGRTVLERGTSVAELAAGGSVPISFSWTPAAAGSHRLAVVVDGSRQIAESREDNNSAARDLEVAVVSGVVVDIVADRNLYQASSPTFVSVSALNAGPAVTGMLRTSVEDATGAVVAVLGERPASLDYAERLELELSWNTGRTYAGGYAFRVQLVPEGAEEAAASDEFSFAIASDLTLAARLVPRQAQVGAGTVVVFDARLDNNGTNSPLLNAVARLRIRLAGVAEPVVFEATLPVTALLPGGLWTGSFDWPVSVAAGLYDAELAAHRPGEPVLVTALATVQVTPENLSLAGTLALEPSHILTGEGTDAVLTITNHSNVAAAGLPVTVDVVDGVTAGVLTRATMSLDVAAGESETAATALDTGSLPAGAYPVFLRAGETATTLDRDVLRIHGAITAPAIHSPEDGSSVATSHPTLIVNNATSAAAAALAYQFEIYADAALTVRLPGARDVAEGPERTGWAVVTSLTEDETYYWRGRATDGFSTSAWTDVGSFTVDAVQVPPTAPVPESPYAGERVAVREPTLVTRNSFDPDSAALRYDFRLATDSGMTAIVASAADVPSGSGLTSWQVPLTLQEDADYYWYVRARDESSFSLWSTVMPFVVDSVNEPPTAPVPVEPAFAARVTALSTPLVVGNAHDPEGETLSYRFQIDRVGSFDSSDLQETSGVAEASGQTAWTPPEPFSDHTTYYWRASAFDGVSHGSWGASEFTVNLANEPPDAPVPLAPANGQIVTTLTPELRVRNASDPDRDLLSYEFRVTDEADREVASVTDVEEGATETGWTLPSALVENGSYAWAARAHDPELAGPWTPPWSFRVNTVQEPPSAPTLVAPSEGSVLGTRRPELIVSNATSFEGLPLSYTFELSRVALDGTLTVVERVGGIPEGGNATRLTPSADLPDGSYSWTARAEDVVPGAWMEAAHFSVAVDLPPAPPTGLTAVPGDSHVSLSWNANAEPGIVGYRVYRSLTSGGDYDFVTETTEVAYLDSGLQNGVTVYYVVTAIDFHLESEASTEVAATPTAPSMIEADVWYRPDRIPGECLLAGDCHSCRGHSRTAPSIRHACEVEVGSGPGPGCGPGCGPGPITEPECPDWVKAAVELPAGYDVAGIDRSTVRLGGSVSADPAYFDLRDEDHDGRVELHLRFEFDRVAPLLEMGPNQLSLTGGTASVEFHGASGITVLPLDVSLWVTPRTLHKRSCGQDVMAHLGFHCVDPRRVDEGSLRLNGVVPARRVVSNHSNHLIVKFDRREVARILPSGDHVRIEVSGTLDGFSFTAVDHIRVTE